MPSDFERCFAHGHRTDMDIDAAQKLQPKTSPSLWQCLRARLSPRKSKDSSPTSPAGLYSSASDLEDSTL